ncbi:hypothetical protein BDZ97DRAFT_1923463 [Flammula alnicola]|nr:hypothetical protein BDZ97DRAFT_1923463 [Flammula alnicola]
MSPAGSIGLFESTAGPQDSWYSAHHLIHAYDWGHLIKALHCCPSSSPAGGLISLPAIPCNQPEPSTIVYLQCLDVPLQVDQQIWMALELHVQLLRSVFLVDDYALQK